MSSLDPSAPPRPSHRGRKAMLILAIVGILGAIWFILRPQPKRLFNQGLATSRRDPAAAERLFRRAIAAADGKYPDAQVGLCAALARQGDWEGAQRQFAAIDPSDCRADVLLEFGRESLATNRISEARKALEAVARRDARESTTALELLLTGYRRRGLQDELVDVCQQLTRMQPDRFDVWAILVEALKGMKLEKECLDTASEALDHDPPEDYRREFQYLILEMTITRGDAARSALELTRLRELEGDTFRVRAGAASVYRLEGRLDEALKAATSLFAVTGNQATAYLVRGFVWLDLGKYEEAAADLKRAVAAQPFNSQAHFKLSEALRALGQPADALAHSKIANDLSTKRLVINSLLKERAAGGTIDPVVAARLAQLFEETGDDSSAAHWRREAAERKLPRSGP